MMIMIPRRLVVTHHLGRALTSPRDWRTRILDHQTRSTASSQQPLLNNSAEQDQLRQARPPSQIPGPRRWPLIGSYYDFVNHKAYAKDKMHMVWESCFEEYGEIFRIDLPGQASMVYISSVEDVEHLMKETVANKNSLFGILSAVRNSDQSNFVKGEAGIMAESHDEWRRVRRLVQGPTLKTKTVAHYLPKVDAVTLEFLEKMYGMRDENNELPEDFLQHLSAWALESLSLVTFGKRIGSLEGSKEGSEMMKVITDMMISITECMLQPGALWKWYKTPAYKRFEKAHNEILRYIKEGIQRSLVSMEHKDKNTEDLDLVEQLLLTPKLKITDIHAYLVDFVLGGIDNISPTVGFTLHYLAQNPEKQIKLQEELDRVLGRNTDVITPYQMAQLSYTKATIKESQRLLPTSHGVIRTLEKDMVFGGYRIPNGFTVFALTKQTGKMEKYFERPNEYLPERWLRDRPLGAINPYSSIPFGIGARSCVGRRFAEQEMFTIVARLFHKYNLEWKYGDVCSKMHFTAIPDKPLKFTITKRF